MQALVEVFAEKDKKRWRDSKNYLWLAWCLISKSPAPVIYSYSPKRTVSECKVEIPVWRKHIIMLSISIDMKWTALFVSSTVLCWGIELLLLYIYILYVAYNAPRIKLPIHKNKL